MGRVLARLRTSLGSDPHHYEQLDLALASKLGGALGLIGILYTLALLPLAPSAYGLGGWLGIIACLLSTALASVGLIRAGDKVRPSVLLAGSFAAPVLVGTVEYLTGPGTPYQQLLMLSCFYAAAIHPFRRVALVVSLITVSAWLPAWYGQTESDFVARTIGQLALWWAMTGIVAAYAGRMRGVRAELREQREAADERALQDPLSGLGNRRALEGALAAAISTAKRHDRPLSALVCDLDRFKQMNDTFGHRAGDVMLRAVADALVDAVRIADPCFRWGGDEFVALLPDADLDEAEAIAHRVTQAVAAWAHQPDGAPVCISVGYAELGPDETGDDLLARADEVMLEVKAAQPGRAKRAA